VGAGSDFVGEPFWVGASVVGVRDEERFGRELGQNFTQREVIFDPVEEGVRLGMEPFQEGLGGNGRIAQRFGSAGVGRTVISPKEVIPPSRLNMGYIIERCLGETLSRRAFST
jgi:hypothetical protein